MSEPSTGWRLNGWVPCVLVTHWPLRHFGVGAEFRPVAHAVAFFKNHYRFAGKDVLPFLLTAGNPARVIKTLSLLPGAKHDGTCGCPGVGSAACSIATDLDLKPSAKDDDDR